MAKTIFLIRKCITTIPFLITKKYYNTIFDHRKNLIFWSTKVNYSYIRSNKETPVFEQCEWWRWIGLESDERVVGCITSIKRDRKRREKVIWKHIGWNWLRMVVPEEWELGGRVETVADVEACGAETWGWKEQGYWLKVGWRGRG